MHRKTHTSIVSKIFLLSKPPIFVNVILLREKRVCHRFLLENIHFRFTEMLELFLLFPDWFNSSEKNLF